MPDPDPDPDTIAADYRHTTAWLHEIIGRAPNAEDRAWAVATIAERHGVTPVQVKNIVKASQEN